VKKFLLAIFIILNIFIVNNVYADDYTPSTIEKLTTNKQIVTIGDTVEIYYEITDLNGIAEIQIGIDNPKNIEEWYNASCSGGTKVKGTININITDEFISGTHTINVRVLDALGNSMTLGLHFPAQFTVINSINDIESIELDISEITMTVNDSVRLPNYTILPVITTQDKTVRWSSSDENVARIENGYKIIGTSPGETIITATTVNGKTAIIKCIVEPYPEPEPDYIHLDKTQTEFFVGDIFNITGSWLAQGNAIIYFESSDESVLKVNHKGVVTAVGEGTATITATIINGIGNESDLTDSVTITTKIYEEENYIYHIDVNPFRAGIFAGDLIELTATLQIKGYPKDMDIVWTISDEEVIKIEKSYIGDSTQTIGIRGLKEGTATITATTSNGLSATIEIEVYKYIPITSITLNKKELELAKGDTFQFIATINPENTTFDKTIKWESFNTNVVTIDQNGLLKAVGVGNATIIAEVFGAHVYADIIVTPVRKDINNLEFIEIEKEYVFSNLDITPNILIKDGDKLLDNGTDYTIEYKNNFNVGTANIIVKGKNNYYGEKIITFKIIPRKLNINLNIKNEEYIYDGEKHFITGFNNLHFNHISIKLFFKDNEGNYTKTTQPSFTNPGTYEIFYKIYKEKDHEIDKNYEIIEDKVTLIINKANITNYHLNNNGLVYKDDHYDVSFSNLPKNIKVLFMDEQGEYTLEQLKFKDAGVYLIKYKLYDENGFYNEIYEEDVFSIAKGEFNVSGYNLDVYKNKNYNQEYYIDIPMLPEGTQILFADSNGNFTIDRNPGVKGIGKHIIKYKLTNKNYNDLIVTNTINIYGIKEYDKTLDITAGYIIIKNFINDVLSLYNRITIYANKLSYKIYDSHYNKVDRSIVKTNDKLTINFDDTVIMEYQMIILGDVNSDGKISALDYVRIKNYIMSNNKNHIFSNPLEQTAADLNEDGKISALDYVRIKNHIMKGNN